MQSELARFPSEVDVQAEDAVAVCEQDVLPPERTDQELSVQAIAARVCDSKYVDELQEAPMQNMSHGFGSRIRGGDGMRSATSRRAHWRLRPRRRPEDGENLPRS